MKAESIEKFLLTFNGAEASFPFGPDALVFKVMGKMFALISQKELIPRVTLKCLPADGEALISQFKSVTPGYYMNKKHWITISLDGGLAEEIILDLANGSYNLVLSKLSKKEKNQLEENNQH